MATDLLAVELLLALVAVALVTLVLALRHRLSFRIATRNVVRARGRTVLLIAGLLVGTTIISGSLVVGDTVQQLTFHYSDLGAGYVDESISGTSPSGAPVYFPYSVYVEVGALVANHSGIVGVAPEILGSAAAYDRTTGIPETALNLVGVNGNQSSALGSFVADNGTTIAGPLPGEVLLDDQTASALNASAGDALVVYGATAVPLKVQAVVQENVRGAFVTAGLTPGNLFVTLATAQALEQAPGMINYIAITNSGSQATGAADASSESAYLNSTLASVLAANHLTVQTPLSSALSSASTDSEDLLTLFLVLALFSVIAGAMLIVGIFVMLADERKGEMGMLRAIGMPQVDLVYSYYFEGIAYASGSALVGTFLGAGVGYVLVLLSGSILQSQGFPQIAIVQSFTVTPQSLVIAYVAGFLLTLVTIVAASARASRLNIVRAIHDVPEPKPPARTFTILAGVGVLLAVVGLIGYLLTYRGSGDLSYPIVSGSLVILGTGLVAARFLPSRWVFTGVGAGLFLWTGVEPLQTYLLGTTHSNGIFNLFVAGIIMVAGMLMLVVSNLDSLAAVVRGVFGPKAQSSPVVRVGLDYPTRQAGRTAITLTIFALVVFTMIATAAAGSTLQGSLNQTVANETGGYNFFGESEVPMPSLWNEISANSTLAPFFVNAVPLVDGVAEISVPGYSANPYQDGVYSAPTNAAASANLYDTNHFAFQSTLNGMSPSSVFHDLATNDTVVVLDESYANTPDAFTIGATNHPKVNVGTVIQVASPGGAHPTNLTVVGILTESIITGAWVNPSTASALGYTNETNYLLTVAPGRSTALAAQDAKRAFFPAGLVLFDLPSLLAEGVSTAEAFIGLLEIFVGLGLGVGIAAIGIFALRAVVERRRDIGMLRAIGFTQNMVLRSFLLEYSFVTILGIVVGIGLGLLEIYNLSISPSALTDDVQVFVAPWLAIVEVAVVAYALVLLAVAVPSLRAARLPPAQALRTTE